MENGLTLFINDQAAIIKQIGNLEKQKRAIDEQEKAMRESLQAAMEKYGITSWSDDAVSITYKDAYQRVSIDSNKLLVNYPEAYHNCEKKVNVKASITIKAK